MKKMSGAKIVCECLLEQGVDTVFGFPGGQIINVYDELYQYRDRIHHILTSHEQGAAHAADGYARTTGKVGVVFATSGPGATNLVTGIATAYMDSIPLVAITGNVAVPLLGRDSFQEVDIAGVTMPVTKHNYIVKDVESLAGIMREAFQIARSGRPGPVLIDIPKDISVLKTEYTFTPQPTQPLYIQTHNDMERAIDMINQAKRPLIYCGGGVVLADAEQVVIQLGEKLQAPICTSLMGKTAIPADHPNYIGMIGMHGTVASAKALKECDLLLAIGARFSDRVAGDRKRFAAHAKILHIDVDAAEISKNVASDLCLLGNAAHVVEQLMPKLAEKEAWAKDIYALRQHNEFEPCDDVLPKNVLTALRGVMQPGDILTTDVGQHQMWAAQYFDTYLPRTFLTSGGLGTMGFGVGAALGAKAAAPGQKVVCVTGDGSFHMNLNELATAVNMNLPIVVLVMNNSVLGMVRQWQKLFFEYRFSSTTLQRKTDYVKLAESFGATAFRITKGSDIQPVLAQAMDTEGTVVIDCVIPMDENVLPMIPPGKTSDEMITTLD